MQILTRETRRQVLEMFLRNEGLELSPPEKDELILAWEAQSEALKSLHTLSTFLINIFGVETGFFFLLQLPVLGKSFRTWLLSLIGMASHGN